MYRCAPTLNALRTVKVVSYTYPVCSQVPRIKPTFPLVLCGQNFNCATRLPNYRCNGNRSCHQSQKLLSYSPGNPFTLPVVIRLLLRIAKQDTWFPLAIGTALHSQLLRGCLLLSPPPKTYSNQTNNHCK